MEHRFEDVSIAPWWNFLTKIACNQLDWPTNPSGSRSFNDLRAFKENRVKGRILLKNLQKKCSIAPSNVDDGIETREINGLDNARYPHHAQVSHRIIEY